MIPPDLVLRHVGPDGTWMYRLKTTRVVVSVGKDEVRTGTLAYRFEGLDVVARVDGTEYGRLLNGACASLAGYHTVEEFERLLHVFLLHLRLRPGPQRPPAVMLDASVPLLQAPRRR